MTPSRLLWMAGSNACQLCHDRGSKSASDRGLNDGCMLHILFGCHSLLTLHCVQPAGAICKRCWDEGLIVITAGTGDVVRLVPPLTVTEADVDECVETLSSVINSMLS